ncbi:hypothetical protein TNCV_477491 [Trichonephila clavipes]|nr:hypothetical protein TNCV_477491 [Trichonephila clavipes]
MVPAYNKKRCATVPFETGIHFRRLSRRRYNQVLLGIRTRTHSVTSRSGRSADSIRTSLKGYDSFFLLVLEFEAAPATSIVCNLSSKKKTGAEDDTEIEDLRQLSSRTFKTPGRASFTPQSYLIGQRSGSAYGAPRLRPNSTVL